MTTQQSPLKIDVDSVIRNRMGSKARRIPRWFTRLIERIIRQDDLNGILQRTAGLEGAAFCNGVLNDLDITYTVEGVLPDPTRRNVIIVSNHPLGALDGITLIDWATKYYGHEVRFMVNDLLMAVDPLKPVFVPVNKFGRQDRGAAQSLDEILADHETPLIIFPAGLCSRKLSGRIADLPWKKTFVSRAAESHRD
ncbi:MAG: 1-acyl-sn-glycerol-3-phosphate acyltransferase, partial [Muribaculum sp.]|nr:1-acyl-sn-glycerol-3-phosphate acyltransferase [Muribaculum sp.]